MLKKVRLNMISEHSSLPAAEAAGAGRVPAEAPERSEYSCEGHVQEDAEQFTVSYREGPQSGMEGCKAAFSFRKHTPGTVFLSRSGQVKTFLAFEEGQTRTASYEAPMLSFEVETAVRRVDNRLLTEGLLELEYTVRAADADPEAVHFSLKIQ